MVRKYNGKTMLKKSRFVKYLEKLSSEEIKEIEDRIYFYVCDNQEYCDKGNYQHLCNIFTSMSLFEVLVKHGTKKEEAEDIVFNTMYEYMDKQKAKFQKLSKKGWFWSIIKKIVPLGFKFGSGHGWKYIWYKKNEPKNIFRFECNSCIYQQIFKKYAFERFGPKFCHNDIIVYGDLARTDFVRTNTLCRGGEKCDFKFIRYKKDEQFERSKSV